MPRLFKDLYPHAPGALLTALKFTLNDHTLIKQENKHILITKNNTVKFLIGITPNGAISYLSKCWECRVTDKYITMNSGFFNLLKQEDVVFADRGFDISDDIAIQGATLVIPCFTEEIIK